MKETVDIKMGYKLQHLVPAFFIIVTGSLFFFLHIIPAILIISFGIALLCMSSGVEIDIKNKKIRMYSALSSLKIGSWENLHPYVHVDLKFTNESQTMHSRGSSKTIRTKTYDLVFSEENGAEYEFNDFTDYTIANQTFKIVASSFGMTSRNIIEEMMARSKQRERR